MIRTAIAAFAILAFSQAAYANLPAEPSHAAKPADCAVAKMLTEMCNDRPVTRGHADLPARHIPRNSEASTLAA